MRTKDVALLASLLLALGCPQPTSIWLAPDAARDRPVFRLGTDDGLQEEIHITLFRVDRCESLEGGQFPDATRAMWFISRVDEARPVAEIVYGQTPPGFEEVAAAKPLEIGECYSVEISGTGELRFRIAQDDRLVPVAS